MFCSFQFTLLREGRLVRIPRAPHSNHFNSRPSARGDISRASDVMRKTYFNSRPSARGDKAYIIKCWKITYFNSRPSARGDALWQGGHAPSPISIHAPPRGATSSELRRVARSRNFNSRPSARGDFRVMPGGYTPGNFNSRPSARGDHQSIFVRTAAASFQFTPLREGRLPGVVEIQSLGISIHAPPRGATIL